MADVPRSMLCRWEAAAWAALYEGDNGPLADARREMMAKIKEPIMPRESVTATPHPWAQSWNPVIDPVREA